MPQGVDLLEAGDPAVEKPKLFVGICLDESSSMGAIHKETISNFNEQLDDIISGAEKNDTTVSFAVFGSEAEMKFFNEPVDELEKLSEDNYNPSGMTAYFEAVGMMIDRLTNETKDLKEDSYSVLLIIVSDGGHNKIRVNLFKRAIIQPELLHKTGGMVCHQDISVFQQLYQDFSSGLL